MGMNFIKGLRQRKADHATANQITLVERACPAGFTLFHYTDIDSTNEAARRLVEGGEALPAVLWAERQTSGRGRRGRTWESPVGNLYCSIIEPLRGDLTVAGQRSYLFGLAIATAINRVLPVRNAQLKWPNDVLIGGEKVAGVLLETAQCPITGERYLISGFGINVEAAPEGVAYRTTTLAMHEAQTSAESLLASILDELKALDQLYRFEGFAAIRAHWRALAAGIGDVVTVNLPNGVSMQGKFADLDDNGALLLDCGNNHYAITAGDVFFGAPAQTQAQAPATGAAAAE